MSNETDLGRALIRALSPRLSEPEPQPSTPLNPNEMVGPFTASKWGGFHIHLLYKVEGDEVGLFAMTQAGNNQPAMWRTLVTHPKEAVRAAERLVEDAHDHFKILGPGQFRPTENLTYDDFVEHLRLRVERRFV